MQSITVEHIDGGGTAILRDFVCKEVTDPRTHVSSMEVSCTLLLGDQRIRLEPADDSIHFHGGFEICDVLLHESGPWYRESLNLDLRNSKAVRRFRRNRKPVKIPTEPISGHLGWDQYGLVTFSTKKDTLAGRVHRHTWILFADS